MRGLADQHDAGIGQIVRQRRHGLAVDGAERLTALAARLGGAGIEVTWDQAQPGTSRFYASDPWGNRLEFTTG